MPDPGTLAVYALLLGVFVVAQLAIRRALKRARARAGGAVTRERIHVRPAPGAALSDPAGVEARARTLVDRGFEDGGVFRIEELGLHVRLLAHVGTGTYAVVYDRHPAAGTWVDLVTPYRDGGSFTVNDQTRASALDEPPGRKTLRVGGADAATLHARLVAERPASPILAFGLSDVPRLVETAYAEEKAWRASRGGLTDAEIRRIAAAKGKRLSDEEVRRARELMSPPKGPFGTT